MYVHFSPMQNKSGLLVYHHAGLTLNLLVLPKMWRPEGKLPNPWNLSQTTLNVIVYEGERHHIPFSLEDGKQPTDTEVKKRLEDWHCLLQKCCDTLSSKTLSNEVEADEDNTLDEDTLRSLSGLMSIIGKPALSALTEFEKNNQTLTSNEVWKAELENLFKLALFSSTRNQFDINLFQSNDQQVVALTDDSTIQEDSPIFRMLAIENFLHEIETHLHKIHQGYVQTTEHLDSIRGSVTGTSLMMLDAGVSLKPKCRYNKFVPDIPLYQVFVTTLDAISHGWCIPTDPLIRHLDIVQAAQKKAVGLRTQLQHIARLPLEIARDTCQRVHLNRLQRFWEPSLNLSKILLRNKPVFIDDSVSGSGGYMWMVSTAAVWESILAQGLGCHPNLKVTTTNTSLPHPWTNDNGNTLGGHPDMDIKALHTTNNNIYIVDGKYKIKQNHLGQLEAKGTVKNEEYQMFTYSHLISTSNTVHVALVYPWNKTARPSTKSYRRFSHTEHQKCTLSLCHVPFPSLVEEDVHSQEKWNDYISGIVYPVLKSDLIRC